MCIFMWPILLCFHFYFWPFLLEDDCLAVLCWFLPYFDMNQPQVYTRRLLPEPCSHLFPIPLGSHRALGWAPCHRANSHLLSSWYTVMCMFPCSSLNLSHPLLPLHVHESVYFVWVSTVALQRGPSVSSF